MTKKIIKSTSKEETSSIQILETFSKTQLVENSKHYLLLEGDLNDELYDEVCDIEFKIFKHWIYEDTEFDDEKEHGPLLVELDEEHKLLEHFSSKLIKQHMGIILTTNTSRDLLIQHILKLRYATLPADENNDPQQKIIFRWYEPRQLFGLLSAFSNDELNNFMQIIDQIIWCEWAFDQGYWYQVDKPKLKEIKEFISPITISKSTIDSIGMHDETYFVRELTRELIHESPDLLKKGDEKMLKKSILNQTRIAISNGIERRNQVKELIYNKLNRDET